MFERVLNTPVLWNITICRLHIQKCKQNHYTELPIRLFQGHLCNEVFRLFMGMQWWNWSCKTTITTDHVTLYILHIKQIVSGYTYCTSKKLMRERKWIWLKILLDTSVTMQVLKIQQLPTLSSLVSMFF